MAMRPQRRPAEQLMDVLPPALSLHHDHADTVVDNQLLAAGLATLSQRQREVLALRSFENLSVADTAAIMRASEGTVKSYTSSALQQLRHFLGHRAPDENTSTSSVAACGCSGRSSKLMRNFRHGFVPDRSLVDGFPENHREQHEDVLSAFVGHGRPECFVHPSFTGIRAMAPSAVPDQRGRMWES